MQGLEHGLGGLGDRALMVTQDGHLPIGRHMICIYDKCVVSKCMRVKNSIG